MRMENYKYLNLNNNRKCVFKWRRLGLAIANRKYSMFLVATILMLSMTLFSQLIVHVNAQPAPGDYIVTEGLADVLCMVTPGGVRTVIYSFVSRNGPVGVAIDSSGNYIIVEHGAGNLSKITPGGVRTVIYSFAAETCPVCVAIIPRYPVGGYLTSVNKLAVLAPYLALVGLVGAVSAIYGIKRKH